MLEGERAAPIEGASTPGPDGFVELPVDATNKVPVEFPTPPTQLTKVSVKPPPGTEPEDEVTVKVTYTDEDDNEEPEVGNMNHTFWYIVSNSLFQKS